MKITIYRFVLYVLIVLLVVASALCGFKILPYSLEGLVFSIFYITVVCYIFNDLFSWAYEVPSKMESKYITALILALIITPATSFNDFYFLTFAFWASALAMASKYILVFNKRNIFNPAALAVVITSLALGQSASWWAGTSAMLPFVLVGGTLITLKMRRIGLVFSNIFAFFIFYLAYFLIQGRSNVFDAVGDILTLTPLIFLATIMLTDPLTSPLVKKWRMVYGVFVGSLLFPMAHIGFLYLTPELALVIGNIFVFMVRLKYE